MKYRCGTAAPTLWRGGRVVDGSGLENQRSESFRGFESRPLRLLLHLLPPPVPVWLRACSDGAISALAMAL